MPGVTEPETAHGTQEGKYAQSSPGFSGLLGWPQGVTALGLYLTLFFIAWQAILTRQAIVSSEKASQVELRAYLIVNVDSGAYQDRENEIRFAGTPTLKNTGKTPAHNVKYRNNSAILSDEFAKTFSFPRGDEEFGRYVIGVDQTVTFTVVNKEYVDSPDVDAIRSGNGKAFYYWGIIEYDDAFGNSHTTEFCHRLYFYKKSSDPDVYGVNGNYVPGRNQST